MTRDESRWPSMWGAGQDPVRLPTLDTTAQPAEDEWRHDAACKGDDATDLFFPVGTGPQALAQTEVAKDVCRGCSVRHECLTFALNTGQNVGVWGGMSEEERRRLRRRKYKPGGTS